MARFCEVCKQPIDQERADALPDSVLCQEHSRQIAEFGGEFITVSKQERTSKPGSLKLNYGGITTQKRRNARALAKLKDQHAARG
jgi:hypothetical protein